MMYQVVRELPLPLGLAGAREVLRVFFERPGGGMVVIVDAQAQFPEAWGIALHDIASHIADSAVEEAIVEPEGRSAFLERIVLHFILEHKHPTDATGPFRPKLDT